MRLWQPQVKTSDQTQQQLIIINVKCLDRSMISNYNKDTLVNISERKYKALESNFVRID